MRVTDVHAARADDGEATMVLDLELSQNYRHPLGTSTPFFMGLSDGVMRATSCNACAQTYFPPRRFCSRDNSTTSWYELPGSGSVTAATVVYSPPPFGGIEAPYVLASIRLDEVDGGITHRIVGTTAPAAGTRVVARYLDGPQAHPLHRLVFTTEFPKESS